MQMRLRGRSNITGGMNAADLFQRGLRNYILLQEQLQGCLISLSALAGSLLLRFISGHLLIEIALACTAAKRFCAINTKIFGDKVLIDLVFQDHAPFAESLKTDQQDQYYCDGIFYHRAQSYKYYGIKLQDFLSLNRYLSKWKTGPEDRSSPFLFYPSAFLPDEAHYAASIRSGH